MVNDRIEVRPEEVALQGTKIDEETTRAQASVNALFHGTPFAAAHNQGFITSSQVVGTADECKSDISAVLRELASCAHKIVDYAKGITHTDDASATNISIAMNAIHDLG